MKHVIYTTTSLLMGDRAADLLTEYAALLGRNGSADVLKVNAIDSHGDDVEATLVLNAGISLLSESTAGGMPEPDNGPAEADLQARITRLTRTLAPYDDTAYAAYFTDDH